MLQIVVGTEDTHFAEREDLCLAVVGELVNHMIHVIDDPDVPLRVVRLDVDLVRSTTSLEEVIPLLPRFDQVSLSIDDEDRVAEHGDFARGAATIERAPVAGKTGRDLQILGKFDLAATHEKDLVGRFRIHASLRTPDVSRRGPGLLRPVRIDLVRAADVEAAPFLDEAAFGLPASAALVPVLGE